MVAANTARNTFVGQSCEVLYDLINIRHIGITQCFVSSHLQHRISLDILFYFVFMSSIIQLNNSKNTK